MRERIADSFGLCQHNADSDDTRALPSRAAAQHSRKPECFEGFAVVKHLLARTRALIENDVVVDFEIPVRTAAGRRVALLAKLFDQLLYSFAPKSFQTASSITRARLTSRV